MPTPIKAPASKTSVISLVATMSLVIGTVLATRSINTSLQQLQVHAIGQARAPIVTLSTSTLFPVWIKHLQAPPVAAGGDFDAAFAPAVPPKPKDDVPPLVDASADLMHKLEQQLTLDGLTNNGAIISGYFVERGAQLKQLSAYDLAGQAIVPRLVATSATTAQLQVGDHIMTLRVPHAVD